MTLSSNNPCGRRMNFQHEVVKTRARRTARRIKGALALAALSLALVALPGQAFATEQCSNANQDATEGQYCTPTQSLQAGIGSGGGGGKPAQQVAVPAASTVPAAESTGPSLPFTGLDVAALAVVALALTGTGVVLRRLATIGDSEK
jgi:hypothetical protein